MTKLYQAIASTYDAYLRTNNIEWAQRHKERIEQLTRDYLPSGSGFDSGTEFDFDKSQTQRLIFNTSFHHMNEGGFYDGWTHHSVIVTPCLVHRFNLRITGKNKRDIKEHIADIFNHALEESAQ